MGTLAGWNDAEVAALCRALRRSWNAGTSKNTVFGLLVDHLAAGLGPLTADQIGKVTGRSDIPKTMAEVRKAVRAFNARQEFGNLQIDLPNNNYQLTITGECPERFRTLRSQTIAMLISNAPDWFTGSMIQGILSATRARAYDLIVEASDDNREKQEDRLEHLVPRVEGTLIITTDDILTPRSVELLRRKPTVCMDRYPSNANDLLTVHHNDWVGGRIAARFLQRKGCKRVIIVKQTSEHEPDQHLSPLKDRERGCREELKRLGIESRRLRPEGDGAAGAKLALEKFENGEDQILPTDGIFATSDRAALGCRSYLTTRKNGALRIPVIGFEGQAFGEYLTPQLPSVFADPEALGKLAARVLLSVISGEASPAPDQHPHYLVQPVLLEPNEEIGIREQVYTSLDDPLQGYR